MTTAVASLSASAAVPLLIFEDHRWTQFLPLTLLRSVFDLRVGAGTLAWRVGNLRPESSGDGLSSLRGAWCRPGLQEIAARTTGLEVNAALEGPTLLLNGRGIWRSLPGRGQSGSWIGIAGADRQLACLFADAELARTLAPGDFLEPDGSDVRFAKLPRRDVSECVELVDWPWNLVKKNQELLLTDLGPAALSQPDESESPPREGVYLLNRAGIRIGRGTKIFPANVIDADEGPVWIGDRVKILPHCSIQGPAYIGDDCVLQAGTVLRGGATLGPFCKVGGEIEGSVFAGYSNKQHTGFLGHSYVGSWVNLGAGSSNSDLKNTYGTVRVPINGTEVETGEMFVGATIGDHAKIGINCAIPTGASIGFSSAVNTVRSPKFVPNFQWLEDGRSVLYEPERALNVAEKMMARRRILMSEAERAAFLEAAAVTRKMLNSRG
ncbi:putative sugar nucleotidyl transferase [Planctomyces sp. SH-PL14]|uniref:putative sugar nucleotidyl transferase n=1 Tax=Planctomyces sp. SH-PL14 TaxID=1632864 RepID=UPI00078E68BB|nr:putative sugar nucleotidyl transferase [Planctomyces sp. SH-PL14]AMV16781.1 Bifunctional protein GlmU [Planctomyces sp. SH-PL14]